MTLEQTTLFGVRGERSRIRKSSPIAAVPGLRGDVVTDYSLAAEAEGGRAGGKDEGGMGKDEGGRMKDEGKRPTPNAQRERGAGGFASPGVILAALTLAWLLAFAGCGLRIRFVRETAYPDAVCERCGKVLDGKDNGCDEEGAR